MPYTMDELDEFLRKDEDEIRRAVERVRKNPVKHRLHRQART